jgi:hypothetical protein
VDFISPRVGGIFFRLRLSQRVHEHFPPSLQLAGEIPARSYRAQKDTIIISFFFKARLSFF